MATLPEKLAALAKAKAEQNSNQASPTAAGGEHHDHSWVENLRPAIMPPSLEDFEVKAKDASIESMMKWRKSALVLNAARRFRYAADIQSRLKPSESFNHFRVGGIALAAISRFKSALPKAEEGALRLARANGFDLTAKQLANMVERNDMNALRAFQGVEGVCKGVDASLTEGIRNTPEEIERRTKIYGSNTYPEKPFKSFFSFVYDAMQDVTLQILACCAVISLIVGVLTEGFAEGWFDGAGILMSILLVVFVTATSDYRQSIQFRELDKEKKKISVEVIRDGKRQKLSVYSLVVGDLVYLNIGDVVPVDGLYVTGNSLVIDDSSMTGESEPNHKNSDQPFLLAGTRVMDGNASILATGVGMNTEWGHLMAKLNEDGEDETPLQVKLSGVATLIGQLGLYVAILVFVILIGRMVYSTPFSSYSFHHVVQVVDFFAVAVTIIVVAVPEGLPLAVTLSLAYAMRRMMNDKALVRKLAACETMGSATTICSDKTGTLTANEMTVVRGWLNSSVTAIDDETYQTLSLPHSYLSLLFESIFTNTGGDVSHNDKKEVVLLGSPTETAILSFALKLHGDYSCVRNNCTFVRIDPFNSKRKRMGVVVKRKEDGKLRAHWKGAAEIVLDTCAFMLNDRGEKVPLDKPAVESIIEEFAQDALRTLSFAYSDLEISDLPTGVTVGSDGITWPDTIPIPDKNMTFLGIVGIKDPLRKGVPASVALCQKAGIKVRMVTGDNITTAKAIARECGILTDGIAIEGPVFREMSKEEMKKLMPNLQVMARSSPSDKHTLVSLLREMGDVVAVTGDGTNDAPALKEADIGLAMGIAGTEVAKESADIIVLDDNFSSIVNVAKWGRSVYTNIQKFVQFQLTVNIVALTTNFISACFTGDAPLTAVQLLWVNLIMDTLGALALATEPPEDSLMEKPPVGRKVPFVSNVMWRNIIGQAIYQLIILNIMQYHGEALLWLEGGEMGKLRLNTIIFNTFVFCQIFNEINSREMEKTDVLHGMHKNYVFLGVISVTVFFQIVLVQYLGKLASTTPLCLTHFLLCVILGVIGMPVAVLVKRIPVPERNIVYWLGGFRVGGEGKEGVEDSKED